MAAIVSVESRRVFTLHFSETDLWFLRELLNRQETTYAPGMALKTELEIHLGSAWDSPFKTRPESGIVEIATERKR